MLLGDSKCRRLTENRGDLLCGHFFCFIFALVFVVDPPTKESTKAPSGLWAAITINKAVFEEGEGTKDLLVSFALVNDGKKTIDPEIESSHLLVNGKELKDWDFIIAGGIRDNRFKALPSNDNLSFAYALGSHFQKPGIYKLHWKGKTFDAPEIVFRVVTQSPNQ